MKLTKSEQLKLLQYVTGNADFISEGDEIWIQVEKENIVPGHHWTELKKEFFENIIDQYLSVSSITNYQKELLKSLFAKVQNTGKNHNESLTSNQACGLSDSSFSVALKPSVSSNVTNITPSSVASSDGGGINLVNSFIKEEQDIDSHTSVETVLFEWPVTASAEECYNGTCREEEARFFHASPEDMLVDCSQTSVENSAQSVLANRGSSSESNDLDSDIEDFLNTAVEKNAPNNPLSTNDDRSNSTNSSRSPSPVILTKRVKFNRRLRLDSSDSEESLSEKHAHVIDKKSNSSSKSSFASPNTSQQKSRDFIRYLGLMPCSVVFRRINSSQYNLLPHENPANENLCSNSPSQDLISSSSPLNDGQSSEVPETTETSSVCLTELHSSVLLNKSLYSSPHQHSSNHRPLGIETSSESSIKTLVRTKIASSTKSCKHLSSSPAKTHICSSNSAKKKAKIRSHICSCSSSSSSSSSNSAKKPRRTVDFLDSSSEEEEPLITRAKARERAFGHIQLGPPTANANNKLNKKFVIASQSAAEVKIRHRDNTSHESEEDTEVSDTINSDEFNTINTDESNSSEGSDHQMLKNGPKTRCNGPENNLYYTERHPGNNVHEEFVVAANNQISEDSGIGLRRSKRERQKVQGINNFSQLMGSETQAYIESNPHYLNNSIDNYTHKYDRTYHPSVCRSKVVNLRAIRQVFNKKNLRDTCSKSCRKGCRLPYSRAEDERILGLLCSLQGYDRLGGNELWKEIQKSITGRSWMSLKNRFHRNIKPKLRTVYSAMGGRTAIAARMLLGRMHPNGLSHDPLENRVDNTSECVNSSLAEDNNLDSSTNGPQDSALDNPAENMPTASRKKGGKSLSTAVQNSLSPRGDSLEST